MSAAWEPVIGLEVHCQLRTETKLFCGCRNAFGESPNTLVCPVCTGQPGALPVLNREALALAVRVALAVEAEVAPWSRFDRKNYFYCDLPKGFQTTQYAEPFATGGVLVLANGRRVRLTRIHLEEDAGKAIHDRGARTLVDLNRAGVPLIEIVTEPDLRSAEEAHEYLVLLREILVFAGVDGAGKGETVNLLNEWMDPRWLQTRVFDEPADVERERPEFWRYWLALPPRGRIGMFPRSWSSPPPLVPPPDLRARFLYRVWREDTSRNPGGDRRAKMG